MLKWKEFKEYVKNHKFHSVVVVLLVFASLAEVAQFRMIAKNYLSTQENEKTIKDLKSQLDTKGTELQERINNVDNSVNSRVDILDSSIKINEKRKMLIKK